jgi:hypothetical protein
MTQIKASDLRIGNLIVSNRVYFENPVTVKVTAIGSPVVWFEYNHEGDEIRSTSNPYNQLSGLPITEELLLKAGFDDPGKRIPGLKGKGYLTLLVGVHSMFIVNNGVWEFNANVGDEAVPFPCPQLKYFHQLQNLYFALTGKELTL